MRGRNKPVPHVRILPGAPTYPQFKDGFDQAPLAVGYLVASSFSAGQAKPRLLASNAMRWCPRYMRLCESPISRSWPGKTNVRPVDGPAVTDRDKR
jgi:hypothetical protein